MPDKKKILVIEDDAIIVSNIVTLLTEEGYSVEFSYNGKDGLEKAFTSRHSLILCDVMMPEMNGFEVKEKLNKNNLTFDVPFLFLTAKTAISDLRKGMKLEADDYIFKPYKADDLLDIIKNRIEKRERTLTRIKSTKVEVTSKSIDNTSISMSVGNVERDIDVNVIKCIISNNQYSEIILKTNQQFLVRKALSSWEALLPMDNFLRIHRKTIVNINEIEKVYKESGDYKVKLLNYEIGFSISRRAMVSLKEKMNDFIK